MSVVGRENWEAERQRGCPEWMGGTSVLDASFLSQGDTSAFSPSKSCSKDKKCCSFLVIWCGGLWDAPASLIPKEIQDGSTYIKPGGRTLPL